MLLDEMVLRYQGAYTHDDVFALSVDEVYTFKLIGMAKANYQENVNKVQRQEAAQKRKKK